MFLRSASLTSCNFNDDSGFDSGNCKFHFYCRPRNLTTEQALPDRRHPLQDHPLADQYLYFNGVGCLVHRNAFSWRWFFFRIGCDHFLLPKWNKAAIRCRVWNYFLSYWIQDFYAIFIKADSLKQYISLRLSDPFNRAFYCQKYTKKSLKICL